MYDTGYVLKHFIRYFSCISVCSMESRAGHETITGEQVI